MIDWNQSLRLKGSKRQVYRTGFGSNGTRSVDIRRGIRSGILYNRDGTCAIEGHPWGDLENFDELDELLRDAVIVETPEQRRFAEQLAQDNADNPLFGLF